MTMKLKIILSIVALLTAYGFGRWSAPEKVKIETQTVEVEKKTTDTKSDLNLDRHKQTTTTSVKKPDGTVETTTTTTEDAQANRTRDSQSTDQTDRTISQTKEVTYSSAKVTISALGGLALSGTPTPVWGASVSKPVLGPVTIGLWGLNSGTVGASLGLSL